MEGNTIFSNRDLKVKLVYMGFGGMIAIIGTLFAIGMLSCVTVQKDKFDTIQCSRLEILNKFGVPVVIRGKHFVTISAIKAAVSLPMRPNRGCLSVATLMAELLSCLAQKVCTV